MKKISLLLIAVVCTTLLQAQDSVTSKFSFNHLALSVKDVNRSAEFYSKVLQLPEIINRTKIEGINIFCSQSHVNGFVNNNRLFNDRN